MIFLLLREDVPPRVLSVGPNEVVRKLDRSFGEQRFRGPHPPLPRLRSCNLDRSMRSIFRARNHVLISLSFFTASTFEVRRKVQLAALCRFDRGVRPQFHLIVTALTTVRCGSVRALSWICPLSEK